MTYHVTELDIRSGEKSEPGMCPVALAIKRAHPLKGIFVTSWYVVIGDEEKRLPPQVQEFIRHFDLYEPVRPIWFEL